MLVASDTSPISNLAIIGRLDLLRSHFGEIWIPEAVKRELQGVPDPAALAAIEGALRQGWIRSRVVQGDRIVRLLQAGLHEGEAEAIVLGLELAADMVLLDEREGRNAAERAGLRVTGVLGILLRAKLQGAVPSLKAELEALWNRARFFVAVHLEEQILHDAGEG